MPSRLNAPVLIVDVGLIHKVDTRNVENLFSMWTGECPRWNWVHRQRVTCLQSSHDALRQWRKDEDWRT
jgi:hypothetical protein